MTGFGRKVGSLADLGGQIGGFGQAREEIGEQPPASHLVRLGTDESSTFSSSGVVSLLGLGGSQCRRIQKSIINFGF